MPASRSKSQICAVIGWLRALYCSQEGRRYDHRALQPRHAHRVERGGKTFAGKTPYDLMRATFPAGTVSGAPKIRAMQIISELEGTTRGPYGGCVGYFSFNGNLDTCITIRTALLKDGKAYVQAGGGWVNDSEPESEFEETVNKSKAMLKAVALAKTFAKPNA